MATRPGPLRSLEDAVPGRFYARHSRCVRRPQSLLIDSPATAAAAAKARARANFLARFDEDDDDDAESSSSESETSSSSSDAPTSDDEATPVGQRRPGAPPVAAASATTTAPPSNATGGLLSARAISREARLKMVSLLESLLTKVAAPHVERALFQKHGAANAAYNSHARDLIANLRVLQTAASPMLHDIQTGVITATQLVNMSSAQLAPEALQEERAADAENLLKTTLVRQKSADDEESQQTIQSRRRDEAATQQLEAVIHLAQAKEADIVPAAGSSHAASAIASNIQVHSSIAGESASASGGRASAGLSILSSHLSEADAFLHKFAAENERATKRVTTPMAISPTTSTTKRKVALQPAGNVPKKTKSTAPILFPESATSSSDESEPKLILLPDPKPKPVPATNTIGKPRSILKSTSTTQKRPAANGASNEQNETPQSDSVSPSRKKKKARIAVAQEPPISLLSPPQPLPSAAASLEHPPTAASTKLSDVIDVSTDRYTPTPPPEPAAEPIPAPAAAVPEPPKVHPTDPITLPERDDSLIDLAMPSFTGRLSVEAPRRADLPLAFYPLPTANLFASGGPLARESTTVQSKHDVNCWQHILPEALGVPQRMKAAKLETYIRYKANLHLEKTAISSSTSVAPSLSIQAASKLYPITFVVKPTDPLLIELHRDLVVFLQTNSLAFALDYESSRTPAHKQANVWLIPPGCLHYISDTTAREIFHWELAQPRADDFWGILWCKQHVFKTMRKAIEIARRQAESELDVPSDEETDAKAQATTVSNNPIAVGATPAAPATSLLSALNDPNYLVSLLSKAGAAGSSGLAAIFASSSAPPAAAAQAPPLPPLPPSLPPPPIPAHYSTAPAPAPSPYIATAGWHAHPPPPMYPTFASAPPPPAPIPTMPTGWQTSQPRPPPPPHAPPAYPRW